jgi:hypothetical protein
VWGTTGDGSPDDGSDRPSARCPAVLLLVQLEGGVEASGDAVVLHQVADQERHVVELAPAPIGEPQCGGKGIRKDTGPWYLFQHVEELSVRRAVLVVTPGANRKPDRLREQ